MYPNNIFVYKNGAIRQENKAFRDDQEMFCELEIRHNLPVIGDKPEINLCCSRNQKIFYRYTLPNLNIWIEE